MTRKVFFLGAGFSKAVNGEYPLMRDLHDLVHSRIEKDSVLTHWQELAPIITTDIESLLSYLSTPFPWKTDTTQYANKALFSAIVKSLSEIFLDLDKQDFAVWDRSNIFVKLAEKIMISNGGYHFVTLNYDILLEQLLLNAYHRHRPMLHPNLSDFYSYPMTWIGERASSSHPPFARLERGIKVPKILKLHGSANWFWAGVSASDILYYKQDYNKYSSSEPETLTYGLKPYIIPPMLDKSSFYNHIAIHSLWKQAEELLQNADEIYIIGFSFPQTDLAVKYLFQSALRKRNPKIYVVNSAPKSALIANYQAVFGDMDLNYVCTGHSNVVTEFITQKILDEEEPHA